jgi:hypothetical protein
MTISNLQKQLEEAQEELRELRVKKKKVRRDSVQRWHADTPQLAERIFDVICCAVCLEPFKESQM